MLARFWRWKPSRSLRAARSLRIATVGVRIGDYRILYFADKPAREIVVGVIAHRKDVYRNNPQELHRRSLGETEGAEEESDGDE